MNRLTRVESFAFLIIEAHVYIDKSSDNTKEVSYGIHFYATLSQGQEAWCSLLKVLYTAEQYITFSKGCDYTLVIWQGVVSMAAASIPLPFLAQKLHPRKDCRSVRWGRGEIICHMLSVGLFTLSSSSLISPSTDRIFLQSSLCTLRLGLRMKMRRCVDVSAVDLILWSISSVRRAGLLIDSWIEQEHKAVWFFSPRIDRSSDLSASFLHFRVCNKLLKSKPSMYDKISSFICGSKSWQMFFVTLFD